MCGIAGSTRINDCSVQDALKALAHRGPDQYGYDDSGPTLGHQRLSIIDLSEGGKQPMSSKSGSVTIVFNGEIYNYQALKKDLISKGVQFKNETDTEVILEGYEKEGVDFFNKLRGMWAFSIWDRRSNEMVISRDQFGIKPLYYSLYKNELLFASELKAFRSLNIPLEPNTGAYSVFFNLGYFCAPDTCYKNIHSIMPGETLVFNTKSKNTESFFLDQTEVKKENFIYDEEQVIENLDSVLQESIEAHYVSDVPVGILFSGGNDSALIAALSLAAGRTPEAFHLSVEGSPDTEYAKQIGKSLGLSYQSVPMTQAELLDQYEAVWDIVDAPFSDPSIIPTSLIYKKIRGKAKVVLSGEGGDEWFGGYHRHNNLADTKGIIQSNKVINLFSALYGSDSVQLKYLNPIIARVRDQYLKYGDDIVGQYLRETKNIDFPIKNEVIRTYLFEIIKKSRTSHPGLFFDQALYLVNDLLYKNDMASMASSIEARVPLVDKEVYKFIEQRIPPHMRLSSQYSGKYLLKKILEKYLPHDLVYRRKSGFSFSFSHYDMSIFKADLEKSLLFHKQNAEAFGVQNINLFDSKKADILIKKYPRFAFGLVSNWKLFK